MQLARKPVVQVDGTLAKRKGQASNGLLLNAGHALDRAFGIPLDQSRKNGKTFRVAQDVRHGPLAMRPGVEQIDSSVRVK